MITISGYRMISEIHESLNSIAFQAVREADGEAVIIKVLKDEYPPPGEIVKYKREFEIGKTLRTLSCIAQILGLERKDNRLAMILEDFGGQSLKKCLARRSIPLEEGLYIASQTAVALAQLHEARVIHKDINPANIVYNQEKGLVKIIDFGIATLVPRENVGIEKTDVMEGTLAYISPEQTGRTNTALDYRTDLYSFGATLYQLFTNHMPFEVGDTNALVHSHLFKMPVLPHEIDSRIPEVLSQVILKLMAKAPDLRYQSAWGVNADLEECRHQLSTMGKVTPFVIGRKDISLSLTLPEKLYGREAETEALSSSFEKVGEGLSCLVLVSGYSGIGKTSLVGQLFPQLNRREGFFASGKFDLLQRGRPYSAFADAFQKLVRRILAETEDRLDFWKEQLLAAMGANAQVMVDLCPELTLIIGPQPTVPELPPTERQNRFNLVFEKFLGVFGRSDNPLVLFIDDLQWADVASLKLLELCLCSPESRNLTIVGAYRDNEVGPGHPLLLSIASLEKEEIPITRISLAPLPVLPISEFLADTLRCPVDETRPLAELLLEKTGGNPFFLREYVRSLHEEGLLSVDQRSGAWGWELERIRAKGITDNVADLLVGKMQRLDPGPREALRLCASLGNQIDLQTLAVIAGLGPPETIRMLFPSVSAGFLIPLSGAYKAVEQGEYLEGEAARVRYRFAHDRIQQAAYSLIPETERPALHLRIARRMASVESDDERDRKLFDLVHHMQLGRTEIQTATERFFLCQLLCQAGCKAKGSAAFGPAMGYLKAALELITEDDWERDRAFMVSLHTEAAEGAYLTGDYGLMEQCLEKALGRTRDLLERVNLLEVRIRALTTRDLLKDSVMSSIELLGLLGVHLPRRPTKLHVLSALLSMRASMMGKSIEGLFALPALAEPLAMAPLKVLVRMGSAAYLYDANLYALVVFAAFRQSVRRGNCAYSAIAYCAIGVIHCGVLGDVPKGHAYGKLALKIAERFNNKQVLGYVLFVLGNFVVHWKEPLKETLGLFLRAYENALEAGDAEFVCYSTMNYGYHAFLSGKPLSKLDADVEGFRQVISRIQRKLSSQTASIYHQTIQNLLGKSANPTRLIGAAYDEDKVDPSHMLHRFDLYFTKMILHLLFREHEEAVRCADELPALLDQVVSTYAFGVYPFYDSLSRLGLYEASSVWERRKILARVRANLKKLRRYARHAPMNYQHKLLLVEAEFRRVQKRTTRTTELYLQSVALAKEHDLVLDEALASELAAHYFLKRKKMETGKRLMMDARYAYLRWGATAKVADIDFKYGYLRGAVYGRPG